MCSSSTLASCSLPSLPCACATIRRASRAVTQLYGAAMRETDLEVTQFTLLQALSRTGELTQGQLAELMVIDSTTLSRSLSPLEKRGWIATRTGEDRRQRYLRITPQGTEAMEQALRGWDEAQSKLRNNLGEQAWTELFQAMEKLTAAAV